MASHRPQLNVLERAIGEIAPKWAFRRLQAKTALAMAGGYSGASRKRHALRDYTPPAADAVSDINPDLPDLRARSRDLNRNSMLGHAAIGSVLDHAVGTGLSFQSRIDAGLLGLDDEAAAAWQDGTERRFNHWAKSHNCDVTRQENFYNLQRTVLNAMLESGDVLALMVGVRLPNWPYALAVQTVEADRVCNRDHKPDTERLVDGVEFDDGGAPVRYHVARYHPGRLSARGKQEWRAVEAFGARTGRRNALLIYDRTRPGQVRGVPLLAPVIEALKQISRYTEAELQAAVINAVFAVFMKMDAQAFDDLFDDEGRRDYLQGAAKWNGKIDSAGVDNGGKVVNLMPGEEPVTVTPGRPNPDFEPFFAAIASQIGAALGIPFEVLIKRFNSSYSASKAAFMEAWRFFYRMRDFIATEFCQPIYEAWLDDEVASGRIVAPGYFSDPLVREAWCAADWVGDGPGSLDPLKDVKAARERVDMEISTLSEESIQLDGKPWHLKHRQRKRELELQRRDRTLVERPGAAAQPQQVDEDAVETTS